MPLDRVPPAWRMPEGVNVSLWEYLHTPRLAVEEDAYFAGHPLFEADARILDSRLDVPGRLVDLGCGAGRHALRFAARGFPVVAVDLSRSMLETVLRKADDMGVRLLTTRANLCRLGCFPDATFDLALSMFSTLGMIRGRAARRRALGEACRILRPGGRLVLHVHNLWLNLRDPQGRIWLMGQLARAIRGHSELGDRRMTYRGIPGMEVHLYRLGEIRRELGRAGFRVEEVIPLEDVSYRVIERPRLLPGIRAGGWILFARKPG
ncbi:Glycine/sarcosine N-methyltransferase [Aquisphaera giovannonii]|uniref:Glycine/sarcosine N-methyltransferase n=1 Tax=Aquisphaera giovannonii TaxID=406548 RepID=A0A5B9WB82_9BACT|nr:class I SAM-dependent methyltransferase [Aquisphaera giovannonii]QEH37140.1 Glycine/sarcosine N-methyltransferase [Aquisphaera giovannonii]